MRRRKRGTASDRASGLIVSWYYTDDDHLAIYEGVHCLAEGNGHQLQIQPCGGNNQGMSRVVLATC